MQFIDGENIDRWHLDNVRMLAMELKDIKREKFDGFLAKRHIFPVNKLYYTVTNTYCYIASYVTKMFLSLFLYVKVSKQH